MSNELENTELAVAEQSAPSRSDYDFKLTDPGNMSLANIVALSKLAARGGMSDPKGAEGLAIRSVFGVQMGFTPVEGMQGLYLIEGKPVVGAQLLAKRIKQSDKYDYRVVKHTAEECEIEGFEIVDGEKVSIGTTSFTIDQARTAELTGKNIWKKYPKNMLFARAMADMHRFNMPDLIGNSFITDGEEIVREEPNPVVNTATKAMEAATKKASAGREPKKKDDNVIEAEFTPVEAPETPLASTSAETAPDSDAAATPTPDGSTTEPEEEHPSISNNGKDDPFEASAFDDTPVWTGEHVGLRPFENKDKGGAVYYEIYVLATGAFINGMCGKDKDAMTTAAQTADKFAGLPDDKLKAKAGAKGDGLIAAKIAEHRAKTAGAPATDGTTDPAPEPEAPAETIAGMKAESDGDYEELAAVLRLEIGDESFAKLAADAAKKGVDYESFVTGAAQEVRAAEGYESWNEMTKFTKVAVAYQAWATAEVKAKG